MNDFFVYKYDNGLSFVSTANPTWIESHFKGTTPSTIPKAIGKWRYKSLDPDVFPNQREKPLLNPNL